MSSASIQSEINRLQQEVSRLLSTKNQHDEKASKAMQACAQKVDQAHRTSSMSTMKNYLRSAESEEKKAIAENKKSSNVYKKITATEKKIAEKRKAYGSALKQENDRAERDRKSLRRKLDQETIKRQQQEKQHARELARLSRPEIRHVIVEPPKPEKLRILYLTSNPKLTSPLRTDAEVNSVLKELRSAKYRDLVELHVRPAATPQDLLDGINDIRPHVVHFSGHGGAGLVVFDNASMSAPEDVVLGFDLLGEALAATESPPTLLVMNACSTLHGSDVLLEAVPVLIGMEDSVGDAAAGVFATQFYSAVASGQPIGHALKQAKVSLKIALMRDDAELPTLICRDDIDPQSLSLVSERGVH